MGFHQSGDISLAVARDFVLTSRRSRTALTPPVWNATVFGVFSGVRRCEWVYQRVLWEKAKKKKKTHQAGVLSYVCALTGDIPVKNSPNSCSSFMALSKVFLACSSVSLLFMSLRTGETAHKGAQFISLRKNSAVLRRAYADTQRQITRDLKPRRRARGKEYSH